ncbi:hypothetical protein T01_14380 [Trichinella spiralis]|uniref:Uncharacterized protein n=1 Tax=Trichinella spiralis TaxID=6334 RepID=A0A0V1C1L8_TRISP|nr:hypothetical protein T01_14380 [Trichinella spiralis]
MKIQIWNYEHNASMRPERIKSICLTVLERSEIVQVPSYCNYIDEVSNLDFLCVKINMPILPS